MSRTSEPLTLWLGPLLTGLICGLLWAMNGAAVAQSAAGSAINFNGVNSIFRFGFSAEMFPGVDESDARAAMKLWVQQASAARNIAADPDPLIFRDVGTMVAFCQTNRIDGLGLTVTEYVALSRTQKFDRLGVAAYDGGRTTEQYVVLVPRDSSVTNLSQLAGRTLNMLESPRMSLARIWLDDELVGAGQKPCSDFFAGVATNDKPSLVVLPVFFHQVDACLTTSNSFTLMGEMNPQLLKQVRILAISPAVIPAFFAFCRHGDGLKDMHLFEAMKQMHLTSAGKQILTLVQAESIEEKPVDCLAPSLDLITRHERLCGGNTP